MVPANEIDLGERQPEADENFLNSSFLALIRKNHVVCLDCGRNGGALRNYLSNLFLKAEMPEHARKFELARIGNPNRISLIERIGVKSIDLKIDIASATAESISDDCDGHGIWSSFRRYMGSTITALTARDADLAQLRKSEKGTVKLTINVKGGDLSAVCHSLDLLAGKVSEDEEADDFTIHLRDNETRITPSEMSIRKTVRIEAQANYIDVSQAWDSMIQYIRELEESGVLEV
ncbi:hypothetical protein [Xanthobacter agilis]|uniref:Uncharacterized protein n=1 Tax=Xanthobacter agilis TaxID=47492 RepID=A0ABU0L964_XANAG|nr:hypothetical protein [Xanthobacter agilis]MDQ0503691.1 hypothetical protein [Xanthobacter agilis]